MATRVRFRFNRLTGEVEEFLVDDQDRSLPEAEHDRIAAEVGRAVSRRPLVTEAPSGPMQQPVERPAEEPQETERDREKPRRERGGSS